MITLLNGGLISVELAVNVIYKNINALSLGETCHLYTDLRTNLYMTRDVV